MYVDTNI